jgi:hypothetical protein
LPKQTAAATSEPPRVERREVVERPVLTQPVAYIGGRYVYAPSAEQSADTRRAHVRHRHTRAATNIR